MEREALIEVCDDGTFNIRVAQEGWGTIGPRYLRGEPGLPKYKGLDFEEAKKQIVVWNEFLRAQDNKRRKGRRR